MSGFAFGSGTEYRRHVIEPFHVRPWPRNTNIPPVRFAISPAKASFKSFQSYYLLNSHGSHSFRLIIRNQTTFEDVRLKPTPNQSSAARFCGLGKALGIRPTLWSRGAQARSINRYSMGRSQSCRI